MFTTFFTVALFVATSLIHSAFADFSVNNPDLVQCQSTKISWERTKGPYDVIVAGAGDRCGDPLVELGEFNKTVTYWTVNLPAGTEVYLSVLDANDDEAWSKKLKVVASSNSSCVKNTPSTSSSSSPAASSPSPSPNVDPIGAANAGSLSSSAITVRQASIPVLALAGLAVVVALFL